MPSFCNLIKISKKTLLDKILNDHARHLTLVMYDNRCNKNFYPIYENVAKKIF